MAIIRNDKAKEYFLTLHKLNVFLLFLVGGCSISWLWDISGIIGQYSA